MNDYEYRQHDISDEVWARTSHSYKMLKPKRNFNEIDLRDESVKRYQERLQSAGYHIPLEVLEQWLYLHYFNFRSVQNYGWLDYSKLVIELAIFPVETICKLNVIEDYRRLVRDRSANKPYSEFSCKTEDIEYWKIHNTWRVAPIVLDVNSLSEIPTHAEIEGDYQLVEGHSRLGYFLAMKNAGLLGKSEHKVYLAHY